MNIMKLAVAVMEHTTYSSRIAYVHFLGFK